MIPSIELAALSAEALLHCAQAELRRRGWATDQLLLPYFDSLQAQIEAAKNLVEAMRHHSTELTPQPSSTASCDPKADRPSVSRARKTRSAGPPKPKTAEQRIEETPAAPGSPG